MPTENVELEDLSYLAGGTDSLTDHLVARRYFILLLAGVFSRLWLLLRVACPRARELPYQPDKTWCLAIFHCMLFKFDLWQRVHGLQGGHRRLGSAWTMMM